MSGVLWLCLDERFGMQEVEMVDHMLACIRKGWTQYANARNDLGEEVSSKDPTATRWCVNGARNAAAEHFMWLGADGALVVASKVDLGFRAYLTRTAGFRAPSLWNDEPERTQAEVIAALEGYRAELMEAT